jgi:hypothetical protein
VNIAAWFRFSCAPGGFGQRAAERNAPRKGVPGSGRRTLGIRQRAFLRERILGSNDKEAALAAGYSVSVLIKFQRLKERFCNTAVMPNRKQSRGEVTSEQHLRSSKSKVTCAELQPADRESTKKAPHS